ncbi:MAG: type II toxin-antitoxin system HicA family toxin [Opitutaceae bacterium]|jgi:predicted RNA binding protein YcfA (HicA-like mRNA interferase family)|nr:type II toxin-antitoxin system HicA family toxin [Opitutaceae bacterium]MBP9914037.1 type II toxin-antitoxin system HicA family toxin [Opitutaceae bacterium]
MPKLPGISQKDAVRVLEKCGFRIVRQGKHITMSNGAVMVQVPRHNPINAYTMGYIAKVAGLSPEQFRERL